MGYPDTKTNSKRTWKWMLGILTCFPLGRLGLFLVSGRGETVKHKIWNHQDDPGGTNPTTALWRSHRKKTSLQNSYTQRIHGTIVSLTTWIVDFCGKNQGKHTIVPWMIWDTWLSIWSLRWFESPPSNSISTFNITFSGRSKKTGRIRSFHWWLVYEIIPT